MAEVVLQLSEEAVEFLHDQVEAGAAGNPSELVEQAVATLQRRELLRQRKLERLRAALDAGEEDLAAGRYVDLTADELEDWFARRGWEDA